MTVPSEIEAFLASRRGEFGDVARVDPLQNNPLVATACPTFIVHCRSPLVAQTRKRRRGFTLVIQNGHFIEYYWLIFLINHINMAVDCTHASISDLGLFAAVTAKRFAGLQMLAAHESDIACTIFLESLIAGVDAHRAVRELVERTPSLAELQDTVLRMAGEFILNHEIAHELTAVKGLRDELAPFIQQQVSAVKPEIRAILQQELFADLVALHVVAMKYSCRLRKNSLRTICKIIAAATCVINFWYLNAPEIARANNKDSWRDPSHDLLLKICVRRYMICLAYIDSNLLKPDYEIKCADDGIDYKIPLFEKLPNQLVNDRLVIDPLDSGSREAAVILTEPIRAHGAIRSIIARIERIRVLEKDPVVEETLRMNMQKSFGKNAASDV